jgi:hypothetical protein
MNRPAPRKSSLAGTSALTPPPATATAPVPGAPAAAPSAVPVSRPVASTTEKPGVRRMNYYVESTEQSGRIRTAYLLGRARYGWRSLTEFQLETIMERVEALEAELNNGEPFAPSNAGTVPAGRPLE